MRAGTHTHTHIHNRYYDLVMKVSSAGLHPGDLAHRICRGLNQMEESSRTFGRVG